MVSFINLNKKIPDIIDSSQQFEWYKNKNDKDKDKDITYDYFEKYDNTESEITYPINYDNGHQFLDYSKLDYINIYPLIKKYFSPSKNINAIINSMEKKYNLIYKNICVLFYRGNDKIRETPLCDYDEYLKYANKIIIKNPNIIFLIQSDETEFIEFITNEFPNNSFYFKDEIRHIQKCNSTVDLKFPDTNSIFSKKYLAITIIMSKCKYIICGSGNCSMWIMLYRNNNNNVIQNLDGAWYSTLFCMDNMNEKRNIIQNYLNSGNNKDCYELCEKVLHNIEIFGVECDHYNYITILFSYYVSSFYHNYDESVKIINHIYDVCEKNLNIKLEFDKNKDFYESQFKYCKEFKPKKSDTTIIDNKYYVTFNHNGGRTGNILFQYLICKLISIKFGHTYICKTNFTKNNFILINEESFVNFLNNPPENIYHQNIIIEGWFQKSDYFMKYRDVLLEIFYNKNNDDYWIINNNKTYVKDFTNCNHNISLNDNDIVLSLRLDDFIQMGSYTTDLIPPAKFLEILSSFDMDNRKLYIVCDKIKADWEFRYIKYFNKYNPILIQNTLLHDCALMRDCKILIHSNSTLCWFMSFLSKNKTKRFILNTNFYNNQVFKKIEESDDLIDVSPLLHCTELIIDKIISLK